ncbi:DUF3298 and DUF4163 domain-containing protein [Flavobacteriaceae bacterium TK19130]|nr:DUF3298 and DUF4163 domain-containing protein [Thermobacterium salinum]
MEQAVSILVTFEYKGSGFTSETPKNDTHTMTMNPRFVVLLLLIVTACSEAPEISFQEDQFTESELGICTDDPCSEITINAIKAEGNTELDKAINTRIQDFIIASLFLGEESNPRATTIEEAAEEFVLAYRDHKHDYPDITAEYVAEISVEPLVHTENMICLELQQYKFTGGAHGYGSVQFANFDVVEGTLLSNEALLKDEAGFISVAEEYFRKEKDIPSDASINSTGFWFENDTFQLPQSIGFTKNNVILHYNAYDIASYAEGAIEIQIPVSEVQPFLSIIP